MANSSGASQFLRETFRKHVRKGSLAANFGTLLAGNTVARVVGFLSAPVITRLYSPDDFGVMTLFFSLVGVFAVVSCLSYEVAIVIPKRDDSALNLLLLCFWLTTIISLGLLVVVGVLKGLSTSRPGIGRQDLWLFFVPVAVFLSGFQKSLDHWFTRVKQFRLQAVSQVIQSLTTAGTKIVAGLLIGSSGFFLIFGEIGGILGAVGIFGFVFVRQHLAEFKVLTNFRKSLEVGREFSKFPKFNAVTVLLNVVSQKLPIVMFAYLFSAEIVGFYGLAVAMLNKPVVIISRSVQKVFLQKAAEMKAENKPIRSVFLKSTFGLAAIGVLPFTAILIWGESIFGLVFGHEWETAGHYSQLLAPWLFLAFINPPATQVTIVNQKLVFALTINIVLVVSRFLAILAGYHIAPGPGVAIILFSLTSCTVNLYMIIYGYLLTGKTPNGKIQ